MIGVRIGEYRSELEKIPKENESPLVMFIGRHNAYTTPTFGFGSDGRVQGCCNILHFI